MKILANSAFLVLALAIVMTYSSCGPVDPPEKPIEEVQLEKLSGTWTMAGSGSNVTLDAVSKKSDYTNFKLILSGTPGSDKFGYTTEGRPPLSAWPSSGQWSFGSAVESMVVRDPGTGDQLNMTYAVSGEQLQITFNFTKAGYSRTKQVTGEWIFTMGK